LFKLYVKVQLLSYTERSPRPLQRPSPRPLHRQVHFHYIDQSVNAV